MNGRDQREEQIIRVHPERIVSWGIGDGSSSRAVGAPPMEEIVPGLRASAPLRLPFGRDLHARAYLLEREHGNVLLYGAAALEPHLAEVEALGGLTRQYLNHSHEATPEANTVAQRFGAPLFVHAADSADTARAATVRDLRPSPPPRRRPRDHPHSGTHAGRHRLPVGHR